MACFLYFFSSSWFSLSFRLSSVLPNLITLFHYSALFSLISICLFVSKKTCHDIHVSKKWKTQKFNINNIFIILIIFIIWFSFCYFYSYFINFSYSILSFIFNIWVGVTYSRRQYALDLPAFNVAVSVSKGKSFLWL